MECEGGMNDSYELKPCPWCEGKACFEQTMVLADAPKAAIYFHVGCPKCHVYAPNHGETWRVEITLGKDGALDVRKDMRQEAADAWNARAV